MKHVRPSAAKSSGAFTVVELLVVLAAIAVVVAVRLPSLASSKTRVDEAMCRNNFRQLAQGAATYASEFDDFYPPVFLRPDSPSHPGTDFNGFQAEHYGRYIYYDVDAPAPFKLNKVASLHFQNLGYLYPMSLAGDGTLFYCPAYNSKSFQPGESHLGKAMYTPLLTTDSSGTVRSSYAWNPWVNPNTSKRLYPRQSDFKATHILQMEYLVNNSISPLAPLDPRTVAHDRSRTVTILMSDHSVRTAKIATIIWSVAWVSNPGSNYPLGGTFGLTNLLTQLEQQFQQ